MNQWIHHLTLYLPYWMQDWITAHIVMRLFHGRKIIVETEGFYIFDDDSILNKIHFIDVCEARGAFWPYEVDHLHNKFDPPHWKEKYAKQINV